MFHGLTSILEKQKARLEPGLCKTCLGDTETVLQEYARCKPRLSLRVIPFLICGPSSPPLMRESYHLSIMGNECPMIPLRLLTKFGQATLRNGGPLKNCIPKSRDFCFEIRKGLQDILPERFQCCF